MAAAGAAGRSRGALGSAGAPLVESRPRELLASARRAQLVLDVPAAEEAARTAFRSGTPSQAADALTILAECAELDGRHRRAIALLHRVAEWYGALPSGKSALYAAGMLESELGDRAGAIVTLRAYLARYPRGRFAGKARARLRSLGAE